MTITVRRGYKLKFKAQLCDVSHLLPGSRKKNMACPGRKSTNLIGSSVPHTLKIFAGNIEMSSTWVLSLRAQQSTMYLALEQRISLSII